MIEKFKDYEEIKKAYPKTMSKDQFYKVAHISKATALFLLQTGLVPCKDSKKKTRRYTIKTKDVISYMQERIVSPEKFRAADGWYLTRSGYGKSKDTGKDKLMSLTPEQCELLRQYFENELTDYNDLIVYFGRRAPLARTFSPTVTAGAPHGRETVVSPPLLPAESVARIKFLRLNGNDQTGMQRVAAYGNVTGHVHEGL